MPDIPSLPDFQFPGVMHGGDYNPEQWPESIWDDDMRLMKAAHVNIATLPVFGWVSLQPDEDTWNFEWLDRVLDLMTQNGVRACLATATASVPAWTPQKYPDVLRVDERNVRQKHGNRHTFCPSSPNFQRLSQNLARQIATRYADHPALLVWHISNEYGSICYCDLCAQAFRVWLQSRYGTLDEVNRRWNTTFWGHTYTNWEQIETPTFNGERSMQSLLIDYNRFASDALLNCCRGEAKILREITPNVPITTNMMGAFKTLDYHRWARELDIVSWDSYPGKDAPLAHMAFNHALMRGLKEGQSWMLMEQTPSQQNWQAHNSLKRPGVMRLWSYQALAHGADTIMYFQWRRSRGAQEKYHGAVVEHVGHENTRVFREVSQLGAELEKLGAQTLGKRVQSDVAVLFDWDNWWAVEYSSGPSVDLKYVHQCQHFYSALHRNGVCADIVSPDADLSNYKVVVAPVLYMLKPGVVEKLEHFVRQGGQFVTTFFSGLVDESDLVYLGGYPGPLRPLLGIWGEEIDALMPLQKNRVVFGQPFGSLRGDYSCGLLCDIIHLEGAQSLATYGDDFYKGTPCVTVNQFGGGRAYYLATHMEEAALRGLLKEVCAQVGVAPLMAPQDGVEVTRRADESGEQLYVLNHNAQETEVALPDGAFRDLLSGETANGSLKLAPYGVSILSPVP